ncbi:WSC domain-containing protein [Paucibacter sp. B2R-40]|uniref:WSC domain-containing protein n=1 Tax=Paucibacter sp. B2R-40 TaxID=2893554 RepID=UPI0021E4CDED|nr:WSC domain-containing protein [Paucibacter sp. B2R-40]MCV2355612.1 WSC domain-containing protein [Paucibacter sp. B2R-40]
MQFRFGNPCAATADDAALVWTCRRALALALVLTLPTLADAGGPPQSWSTRSAPTVEDLDGVAFGDGMFVAVGNKGTILTSPDGTAWTQRASGITQRLRGITYGSAGRIFAAVGFGGTVLHSTDRGLTWTANNVSAGTDLQGIAAGPVVNGGTRFVAIGSSRKVLMANSPVLPFTEQALPGTVPASASLFAVAGLDQNGSSTPFFVITGSAGLVLSSTDAMTWTKLACGYTGNITAVGRQLGQNAVAAGEQSGAGGLTSKRVTVSGSACSTAAAAANAPIAGITFGDGYGVAVGYGSIQYSAQNSISSWTAISAPNNADLHAVAYGNGSFVAVGGRGSIVQSAGGVANTWVGCYTDDEARALPVQLMSSGATPASCIAAAKARGFAYAGVQAGRQCFAGNTLGHVKKDDSLCKKACTAAAGEWCGGDWLNGVHATGLTPTPSPAPQYMGCFTDKPQRALPVMLQQANATRDSCVAAARARGLRYAGLQYKGQCFGGNTAQYLKEKDDKLCNTVCSANQQQSCGGEWHNSVWATGATLPPAPAPSSKVGCYADPDASNRMLPVMLMPSGATPATCVAAARAAGLAYAGTQFGGQCWGGDKLSGTSAPNECTMKCTADINQPCGRDWFSDVFSTR